MVTLPLAFQPPSSVPLLLPKPSSCKPDKLTLSVLVALMTIWTLPVLLVLMPPKVLVKLKPAKLVPPKDSTLLALRLRLELPTISNTSICWIDCTVWVLLSAVKSSVVPAASLSVSTPAPPWM